MPDDNLIERIDHLLQERDSQFKKAPKKEAAEKLYKVIASLKTTEHIHAFLRLLENYRKLYSGATFFEIIDVFSNYHFKGINKEVYGFVDELIKKTQELESKNMVPEHYISMVKNIFRRWE